MKPPCPLPKERGQEVLAPFSLGMRVVQIRAAGLMKCDRVKISLSVRKLGHSKTDRDRQLG